MSLHHFRPARAVLLAAMISGADVIGAPVTGISAAAPSHHQARPVYAEAIRAGTKQLIEAGEIPNAIILVSEGGEIVFRETQGWRDIAAGSAITKDTLFRHFSSSKPMTCAAILTLVDAGLVEIDAPVKTYLPAFEAMQVRTADGLVAADTDITIRHLMTHTSGIIYNQTPSPAAADYAAAEVNAIANRMDETLSEHIQRLAQMPLAAQPGTEWIYGESMGVLGGVVEAVSGQSFSAYLHEHLFGPLQMTDTDFYAPADKAGRLARLYIRDPERRLHDLGDNPAIGGDYRQAPVLEYGGAGLVGTASDAMNFLHMLLNGGVYDGQRVLSQQSVALMISDQLDPALGDHPIKLGVSDARWSHIGFGFCGLVVRDGADRDRGNPGEYGWAGWAGTDMWIDPSANRAVFIATQAMPDPASGLDYPLSDLVRGAIYKKADHDK